MRTDLRVLAFIKNLRQLHPAIGKDKIKPLLDAYCQALGVSSLSSSTIAKVISKNHFYYQKQGRVYHDPGSRFAQKRLVTKLR